MAGGLALGLLAVEEKVVVDLLAAPSGAGLALRAMAADDNPPPRGQAALRRGRARGLPRQCHALRVCAW